jgi:cell division protease FtsH
MVTRFGMSDKVGLMAVGEGEHEVVLGRALSQRRDVSEHTAQLVDQEIKRLLDEAHDRARHVIKENRDLLEGVAQALLDRETLDRAEIALIAEGKELPPLEVPEPQPLAPPAPPPRPRASVEAKLPLGPLTGGPEGEPAR